MTRTTLPDRINRYGYDSRVTVTRSRIARWWRRLWLSREARQILDQR